MDSCRVQHFLFGGIGSCLLDLNPCRSSVRTGQEYIDHLQALQGGGDLVGASALGTGVECGASGAQVARQLMSQNQHLVRLSSRFAADAEGDAARLLQSEAAACELRWALSQALGQVEHLRPEVEAAQQLRDRNAKLRRESDSIKSQAKELKAKVREQLGALVNQNKELRDQLLERHRELREGLAAVESQVVEAEGRASTALEALAATNKKYKEAAKQAKSMGKRCLQLQSVLQEQVMV